MRSITPQFATLPSERADHTTEAFMPYARDERFVRRWAVPGMQGLEHRIGGLEKDSKSGDISYNPENHMQMVETRARKVEAIADDIPMQTFIGSSEGRLLVVGWGGTMGHLRTAVETLRAEGKSVSHCHFNYINPLPHGTKEILEGFERVVVCELNGGQFADYLRSRFPDVEILEYAKCTGQPFSTSELTTVFNTLLEEKND
jgi:2-oxoglutarate ferredoxin oxidoreductase subunit alpha